MDCGSELRQARERLGLSLRDITDRTKIRTATLHAIEGNDFDQLPPAIFTRGFLRTYAREVGLDPQRVADQFMAAYQPTPEPDRDHSASSDDRIEDRSQSDERFERDHSSLVTAALIILAGVLFFWSERGQPPPGVTTDAEEATAIGGNAPAVAVATSGSPQRTALTRVDLLPRGACWVEATVDGELVIFKLLKAGDRYALEGFDNLSLKVGDPAALDFSINGSRGRPLGPPGQAITVHITRTNADQFLARNPPL